MYINTNVDITAATIRELVELGDEEDRLNLIMWLGLALDELRDAHIQEIIDIMNSEDEAHLKTLQRFLSKLV